MALLAHRPALSEPLVAFLRAVAVGPDRVRPPVCRLPQARALLARALQEARALDRLPAALCLWHAVQARDGAGGAGSTVSQLMALVPSLAVHTPGRR